MRGILAHWVIVFYLHFFGYYIGTIAFIEFKSGLEELGLCSWEGIPTYFELFLILPPPIIIYLAEIFFFKKLNQHHKPYWFLSVSFGFLSSYLLIKMIQLAVSSFVLIAIWHCFFVALVSVATIVYLLNRILALIKGDRQDVFLIVFIFCFFFYYVFALQTLKIIHMFIDGWSWLKYQIHTIDFFCIELFAISSTLILLFYNLSIRFLKPYVDKILIERKKKKWISALFILLFLLLFLVLLLVFLFFLL